MWAVDLMNKRYIMNFGLGIHNALTTQIYDILRAWKIVKLYFLLFVPHG